MRTKYHQLSLKDTFSDCQDMFREDTPSFFQLLNDSLDISEFIPADFYHAFYLALGRKRTYPLEGFLSALILQKIFSIPADSLLILSLASAGNYATFAASPKFPMPLFFPASGLPLNLISSRCSTSWSISPNQSAT